MTMVLLLIVFFYLFAVGGFFFIAILYSLITGFWKKDRRIMMNAVKYVLWFIGSTLVFLLILIIITRLFDVDSDQ